MEKRCEFCMALSPIVYCKADAAHLCLSCDAKVHSANALSYRHPRTLVCELCRFQPVLIRCFDHRMFMCQGCDTSDHVSFQHRTRVISCYVGCPSAKELAALWGFHLSELEGIGEDGSVSFSLTAESGAVELNGLRDDNRQGNRSMIMQQILDLERLQLSDGMDNSCLVHDRERKGGSPFRHDSIWKAHKAISNHMDHSDGNLDFQHVGSPLDEKTDEHLSSPFPQLDHLTNTGNPLHGDSFWQFRSPAHNNEIWLQNMQDLGVCDEVRSFDDLKIPDVDLTFRNFEELFGTDHENSRPLVDDKTLACSFADKNPLFNKLDRGCASTIEQSNDFNKEINPSDQVHEVQTNNNHRPTRPSYSASSFSISRITGESSGSEYKDDGLSPTFPGQLPPHSSYDSENTKLDSKENVIMRHKEKKVLRHEKQAQSTFPRSKSDVKKHGKHQILKAEGHDNDSANATRSF